MDMNTNANTESKAERFAAGIHETVDVAVKALCIVMLIFAVFCRVVTVDGNSMRETLHHGDRLFVSGLAYTPAKGDVIILRTDAFGDEALVKRVIATEGDIVDIDFDTWSVYVNGEKLDETYVNFENGSAMIGKDRYSYPLTVGKGEMFVMGDNRNHSSDSRAFGTVDVRNCLGKVYFRLFPISNFGKID